VSGDVIELHREECGAGGREKFYENRYRYKLSGNSLTFTTVVDNQASVEIHVLMAG